MTLYEKYKSLKKNRLLRKIQKSKNKLSKHGSMDVVFSVPERTLDDFAGYESLKEEGQKVLLQATQNYFLEGTQSYIRKILEGLPGVGKSYFSSCLAGEATRLILLNKTIKNRIVSELSPQVRPIAEKYFTVNSPKPKYDGKLGKLKYKYDVIFSGETKDNLDSYFADFKNIIKGYKHILFEDLASPEREKFDQKVEKAFLKELKSLAKKNGLSLDNLEELEKTLNLKGIEKKLLLKKSKDSVFEDLISKKYVQYEKKIQEEIEDNYKQNLVNSILTDLLEIKIQTEEGQSLVEEFSLRSTEELEMYLGETKPKKLIESNKKAWQSVVGKPQNRKDQVAYVEVNGADFAKVYVGTGPKNVEKLFRQIRLKLNEYAAVLLNIEELDALGSNRSMSINAERRATLNKLLHEMSGPNSDELNQGLIITASTNLASILDPAIIRSGRFGKPMSVHIPTDQDLNKIVNYHFSQLKLDDVDLNQLTMEFLGATGADVKELKDNSQAEAQVNRRTSVLTEDIRSALYKQILGLSTGQEFTKEDKEIIAYHEAGHALAIQKLDRNKEVAELVLESHGTAAGFVRPIAKSNRARMTTKEDLMNELIGSYAGIVAEESIFGKKKLTFGAEMDIRQATEKIIRGIKSGILGETYLSLDLVTNSNDMLWDKSKEISDEAMEETKEFIEENKDYLVALKEIGLVKGRLLTREIEAICGIPQERVSTVVETVKQTEFKDEEGLFDLIQKYVKKDENLI